MRADRLLSILLLLQVERKMTAGELAKRLEVSERTILRDMEALCAAGVPLMSDRGTGGGWRLVENYRTDLTGLTGAEAQTLFLTMSSRLLTDLGLGGAASSALIKLSASLPATSRRDIARTRELLHIDGAGWYRSQESFPFLSLLQEAVWQQRKVQVKYCKADGAVVDRLVDPLGLVAKSSVWYCVVLQHGDLRSYRVSRVLAAQITDLPATRPDNFDLAVFWEKTVTEVRAGFPRYVTTLRIAPGSMTRLRHFTSPIIECAEPPDADGWTTVRAIFEADDEACELVMRFCGQIVVIEPKDLAARILGAAQHIATVHG